MQHATLRCNVQHCDATCNTQQVYIRLADRAQLVSCLVNADPQDLIALSNRVMYRPPQARPHSCTPARTPARTHARTHARTAAANTRVAEH